ncbi:MAG TPA: alpha-D-ribose 1-methylphosphonate 5-triphosphate diphosphatase, partial [Paracoccus sp.]|nr:alpha-D-ribose 1-methylphosphonate 5-triphosphate diphosphatase [Paracoccus sp. (in: a-proteobacteria)]
KHGLNEAEFIDHITRLQDLSARIGKKHEAAVVEAAQRLGAVLASHDDTTEDQVAVSAAHGVHFAEFPTTRAAAEASLAHGIKVMMGGPNLIRGGSHSGNVAARELAETGLLDILSSDYVPSSLLTGAMMLGDLWGNLARGIATVTSAPASAVGFTDRGQLAVGMRGDVIRVCRAQELVVLRGTWVCGHRVA